MEAEITKDASEKGVPFVELKFSPSDPRDGVYYITFRKYPKRVFVAYEDYRGDWSSGADLEDCWSAPIVITEKTPIGEFQPFEAFLKVLESLREYDKQDDERGYSLDYWKSTYEDIEPKLKEWLNTK